MVDCGIGCGNGVLGKETAGLGSDQPKKRRVLLATAGTDVAHQVGGGSLVLSSDQRHLVQGGFDIDRMMPNLEDGLKEALRDGYDGLWATGDMTWELGPQGDFSKLLEYE